MSSGYPESNYVAPLFPSDNGCQGRGWSWDRDDIEVHYVAGFGGLFVIHFGKAVIAAYVRGFKASGVVEDILRVGVGQQIVEGVNDGDDLQVGAPIFPEDGNAYGVRNIGYDVWVRNIR